MGDALRAPWLAAAAVALLEGKQPKVVSGRVQVHSVSPAAGRIVVADRTTCADAYLENATGALPTERFPAVHGPTYARPRQWLCSC